jgi:hypothetical protein
LQSLPDCLRGWPAAVDDWLGVLALANRSLITPRLALAIGESPDTPEDVRVFLADILRRNRERNAAMTAQLQEAAEALSAAGIEPVLLKGSAVLAGASARRRDGRVSCDLDLLVRPNEIGRAVAALRGRGYAVFRSRAEADAHVAAELARDGDRASIDLHQRPPGPPGMADLGDLREACARPASMAGVLVPDAAVQVYLLALHDEFHDGDYWSGRLNLRHLLDVGDLAAAPEGIDWGRLDGLVRTRLVRNALDTLLAGAAWLTGAQVPEPALAAWPRLQHRRRLLQVEHPGLLAPFALATALIELPNLLAHRREDRRGRRRLFHGDQPQTPAGLTERWSRLRAIFVLPAVGKL